MKLPKKIEKEKKKKGDKQSPPAIGGGALERMHQFERERGMPETHIEKPEDNDTKPKETADNCD